MIAPFFRATAQLGDPAFRRPLMLGLAGALGVFAGLWAAIVWVLTHTSVFDTPWLDTMLDAFGGLAAVVLTFLLYPAVVAAIMGLFLDQAIEAVERRHYPGLEPARLVGAGEQLGRSLRLLGSALVFNLLALPIYLIPGVNLVVFYTLNGYLLGREYFEMVAQRRLDPQAMRLLWRRRRTGILLLGIGAAFISTIPVVNLAAPLIAAAAMTHQVRSWIGARSAHAPGDG
jgi:CysZ protein